MTRGEKKARTRERLLDAATVVFANKGFAAASLDEIAEEAGLTKGAVYSNFASKDDLLATLFEERVDPRMFAIADQIDEHASWQDQAAAAGQLLIEVQRDDRTWFLLGLESTIHAARHPGFPGRWRQRQREMQQRAAALIEARLAEEGIESPVPAEELALGYFALADGIALAELSSASVPDDLLGKMLGLIQAGLRAMSQTPAREHRKSD